MLLVVIFAGLTFIVLEKFLDTSYDKSTAATSVNESLAKPTTAGITLAVGNTARDGSCGTITHVLNGTTGAGITITSGNYTQTGCSVVNTTSWAAYTTTVRFTYPYTYSADTTASNAINATTWDLYDYGIGFLGIVILVVMIYLIISIVSGKKGGAR